MSTNKGKGLPLITPDICHVLKNLNDQKLYFYLHKTLLWQSFLNNIDCNATKTLPKLIRRHHDQNPWMKAYLWCPIFLFAILWNYYSFIYFRGSYISYSFLVWSYFDEVWWMHTLKQREAQIAARNLYPSMRIKPTQIAEINNCQDYIIIANITRPTTPTTAL